MILVIFKSNLRIFHNLLAVGKIMIKMHWYLLRTECPSFPFSPLILYQTASMFSGSTTINDSGTRAWSSWIRQLVDWSGAALCCQFFHPCETPWKTSWPRESMCTLWHHTYSGRLLHTAPQINFTMEDDIIRSLCIRPCSSYHLPDKILFSVFYYYT
jgi:hypothetical protein